MKPEWIKTISKMTFGIYVLTTAHKETINGMIASWVSMISYNPPLIMAAVHPNRYSHEIIEKSACFALHILSQNQKDFLSRFKGPDSHAKFTGIDYKKGITGSPIISDCNGYMECKIVEYYKPGNHTIYIGKKIDAKSLKDSIPLSTLDYEGVYLGKD
jgi:flavin reductase (DIM6/NTAB) family NADH-FMN oxidoreductase RutF